MEGYKATGEEFNSQILNEEGEPKDDEDEDEISDKEEGDDVENFATPKKPQEGTNCEAVNTIGGKRMVCAFP